MGLLIDGQWHDRWYDYWRVRLAGDQLYNRRCPSE